MIIREGSAKDIHNWFITEKTDETVLCIFLGTSNDDVSLLSDVIDQAAHIDSVIGQKIGFLLCASGKWSASSVDRPGELNIIGGEYKRAHPETVAARDFISSLDLEKLRQGGYQYAEVNKALARSTVRLVPDFMEMYGVTNRELPCIVTLVKGVHTYNVTPCPSDLSPKALVTWLGELREIVDLVERDLLLRDFCAVDIQRRIELTKSYETEVDAKLKKIEKAALGICRKYADSVDDVLPVFSSLSSGELNKEQKSKVMQRFVVDFPLSKIDNRWPKIFSLQERIDELRSLELGALDRNTLKSLSHRLEDEFEKLKKIQDVIKALKMPNSSSRFAIRGATPRYWESVDRVNTATDIMEKASTALKVIGRFLAIGG